MGSLSVLALIGKMEVWIRETLALYSAAFRDNRHDSGRPVASWESWPVLLLSSWQVSRLLRRQGGCRQA